MNEPKTDTDFPLCPHCGAKSTDDDDLCRFCGEVMIPSIVQRDINLHGLLVGGLRFLKTNVKPLTKKELDKLLISSDYSNPANPIWDE